MEPVGGYLEDTERLVSTLERGASIDELSELIKATKLLGKKEDVEKMKQVLGKVEDKIKNAQKEFYDNEIKKTSSTKKPTVKKPAVKKQDTPSTKKPSTKKTVSTKPRTSSRKTK